MTGDQWRVVKRRTPFFGIVYQFCVIRKDEIIPCGPIGDSLDEMKSIGIYLLAAALSPVIDDTDGSREVNT